MVGSSGHDRILQLKTQSRFLFQSSASLRKVAPMNDGRFRKIPSGYGFKWLSCAWHLARLNYKVTLVTSLISVLLLYGVRLTPYLGWIFSALLTPLVSVGLLRFAEKMHRRENPVVEDLFFAFREEPLMRSLAPLMAMLAGLSIVNYLAASLSALMVIFVFFLVLAAESLVLLAVPLVFYKKMKPWPAIRLGVEAMATNWSAYLIFSLLGLFIAAFSILLLAIPLIFAVVPATVSILYLQYHSIFEELDVDALETALEAS